MTFVTREDMMRAHEDEWTSWLPKEKYWVLRLDGRAFHTFTRNFGKPFSTAFMGSMDRTAKRLCEEIQGARMAYVQSDEISILVTAFGLRTQSWFGGSLRKILSISAGLASAVMTLEWAACGEYGATNPTLDSLGAPGTPHFDSRVLTFDDRDDVIRYFLWRQSDAVRNAIQMTAQHLVPHKQLHGKDRVAQLRIIEAQKYDYEREVPQGFRNGRIVLPTLETGTHTYTHKKTGLTETVLVDRNIWVPEAAPFFDWDTEGCLNASIPMKG